MPLQQMSAMQTAEHPDVLEYRGKPEKDFRILVIFGNTFMSNLVPLGASMVIGTLRQSGFDVRLFDTTFYPTGRKSLEEVKKETGIVRSFSYQDTPAQAKKTAMVDDLRKSILEFQPGLVCVSCNEITYLKTLTLLNAIMDLKSEMGFRTLMGGPYPIFSREAVLQKDEVDLICIGESESTVVSLCDHLMRRQELDGVGNIWFKRNGEIVRNPQNNVVNLDTMPCPDFTLWEEGRYFRPMQGKIQRMLPFELQRGCPYTCTYCNSPANTRLLSKGGSYWRVKSVERIRKEMDYYIPKYKPTYLYFITDTFLAPSPQWLEEFAEMYQKYRLPYWCCTRPETLTKENVDFLLRTNADRVGIGIESGNEELRARLLKRYMSNKLIVERFKNVAETPLANHITINIVLGFPTDTRETIFETIELVRQLRGGFDQMEVGIFTPYKGTELREYALEHGLMKDDVVGDAFARGTTPGFTYVGFTHEELWGLKRTFPLYVRLPEEMWPEIRKAEKFDKEGNEAFERLRKIDAQTFEQRKQR